MQSVIAVVVILSTLPLSAAVSTSEREALVALYESTGGPGWTDSSGWLGDPGTECNWFGVTCDEGGTHVTDIYLESNGLVGTLPSELASLTELESLSLVRGELIGQIPPSLGGLAKLRGLNLYINGLTGEIPPELGNLSSLEALNLFGNELSGTIPAALGSLSSLSTLGLAGNLLEGAIPEGLASLINLEELDLSSNDLEGSIPPSIGNLVNLRVLRLNSNRLTGAIPPSLGSIMALEEMDLSRNRLSGSIPGALGSLRSLRSLDLAGNDLTGPIPAELGSLASLEWLVLLDNDLGGTIPASLGNLGQIRVLDLSATRLTGPIPVALASLPRIEQLVLGQFYDFGPRNNQLTGGIPEELGSLSTLHELVLGFNQLGGTIPSSLGNLENLRFLDLSANGLTGPIPASLGNLDNLERLTLAFNSLTGTIPVELGQLRSLTGLDLEVNGLSGSIPHQLSSLTSLTSLLLNENNLTGPIPAELGQLVNLETLDLHGNHLTGPIPSTFANLASLRVLYLFGNDLDGPIPAWIGNLTNLSALLLDGNRFTGPIPPQITNLAELTSLGLGSNFLTGSVPADIGNLAGMTYLSLDSAGLSGDLPVSIWSLTNLVEARLGDNDFTGVIPSTIGSMPNLSLLLLSGNQLSGSLPDALGNLPSITILGLDGNRFSGTVPAALGNATTLEFLGIEKNALRGELPGTLANLGSLQQMRIGFNAVTTSSAALRQFINDRNEGGPFEETQTVAPAGVAVSEVTDRSVIVSWTPISYAENEGGYEVRATPVGGGSTVVSTTGSKRVASHILRGLAAETAYSVTVRSTTHPFGFQQNFLRSDPSAPVSFTTTARQIVPADVDLVSGPSGLIQIGGVPQNEDSYVIGNFGDVATTITLGKDGDHFEQEPSTFVLEPGAMRTVVLRSVANQPENFYWGHSVVTGEGVPDGFLVPVVLFSSAPAAGTAIGEALASRVDVFGIEGTDGVGTVRFRNRGTATLQGVLVSDSSWIRTAAEPITIPPGEVRAVSFEVLRGRRPLLRGAVNGSVRLVYVASAAGKWSSRPAEGTMMASSTLVKVVDTVTPEARAGTIPGLEAGEVRRLIAGASRTVRSSGTFVSDLAVTNAFGSQQISDIEIFFDRAGSADTSVAPVGTITPSTSLVLANVVESVYGNAEQVGTIHIRTAAQERLLVEASISNVTSPLGEMRGSIPVFRTDRAVQPGASSYLMDLEIVPDVETIIYVQEAAGSPATVRIEYRRASGEILGNGSVELDRFELEELAGTAPAGTELVRLECSQESEGAFVAYALVIDRKTGSVSTLVDWTMVLGYAAGETVRVPLVRSETGPGAAAASIEVMNGGGRRRPVARPEIADAEVRTSVTIMNPGPEESVVEISYFESTGTVYRQRETVPSGGMTTLENVADEVRGRSGATTGYAVVEMLRGTSIVTGKMVRRAGSADLASTLPVMPQTAGLRLGQSSTFTGLEDSTLATVTAGVPGTVRTGFAITETAGAAVTVRATVGFAGKSPFVSSTFSRDLTLDAHGTIFEADMLRALLGPQRDTILGDVKNVQLTLSVTSGDGAVTGFVIETENSSGDTRFTF